MVENAESWWHRTDTKSVSAPGTDILDWIEPRPISMNRLVSDWLFSGTFTTLKVVNAKSKIGKRRDKREGI